MFSRARKTIVFDLDDTLYNECDYVLSGRLAVASLMRSVFNLDVSDAVQGVHDDFLGICCEIGGLRPEIKSSLLWVYRLHRPNISPRPYVREVWKQIRQRGDAICILTDGRSITQRLKVSSLGLDPDGLYISEEVGEGKPSTIAFEMIEQDFPASKFVYIADNPYKDFIAPRKLHWQTFGITAKSSNIHPQIDDKITANMQPEFWLNDFLELASQLEH